MKTWTLYAVKGYTIQGNRIKTLVAADSIEEALVIAKELCGPAGWVASIKETNKRVVLKEGEIKDDQSD